MHRCSLVQRVLCPLDLTWGIGPPASNKKNEVKCLISKFQPYSWSNSCDMNWKNWNSHHGLTSQTKPTHFGSIEILMSKQLFLYKKNSTICLVVMYLSLVVGAFLSFSFGNLGAYSATFKWNIFNVFLVQFMTSREVLWQCVYKCMCFG